ncbi:MAG: hypothetical protein FJW35_15600, partial [Acidobacteria bacterium]|nr:hypothetical protein [Acidobacteriota bacterium]
LMRLIHEPGAPGTKVKSVRDSGFYLNEMQKTLSRMKSIAVMDEARSALRELDLFITATDVHGDVYTWFDDQGHAVDVKDHRAVFVLKQRTERKKPFEPSDTTHLALAKLARMTSCLPVAFEPVAVLGNSEDTAADRQLVEWGKLDETRGRSYLDGGVLDNQPFTYTIREIFYRMAHQQVDRKLFCVEPDPERFTGRKAVEKAPSVPRAALKSLVSIPGYVSISSDLRLLTERNEKLGRFNRLAGTLDASTQLPADTESCTQSFLNAENGTAQANSQSQSCLYFDLRLIQLSERVVRGVLREEGQDVLLNPQRK